MVFEISETVTLETLQCSSCSIMFAIPAKYMAERRKDHVAFWCPNGHRQHYPQQSEAERYKKLYEEAQAKSLSVREKLAVAEKAQQKMDSKIKRMNKRVASGVCLCCNRTVTQLASHMKSKHPEFRELAGLNPVKQLPGKVN